MNKCVNCEEDDLLEEDIVEDEEGDDEFDGLTEEEYYELHDDWDENPAEAEFRRTVGRYRI